MGLAAGSRSYLRMLGCERRFISCTSRSMLPRLLVSLFIFSTMICPDWRCRTWRGMQDRLSPTYLYSPHRHQASRGSHPSPRERCEASHVPKAYGTPGTTRARGALSPHLQALPVLMTHIPILPRAPCYAPSTMLHCPQLSRGNNSSHKL